MHCSLERLFTRTPQKYADGNLKSKKVLILDAVVFINLGSMGKYSDLRLKWAESLYVKIMLIISTMCNKVLVFKHIFV